MSVGKLKDWTEEKLEKHNGKLVLVTGTLEFVPVFTKPGVTEDQLAIVAKTLELIPENEAPLSCRPRSTSMFF